MAGNYPDVPSWRLAYDRDGTQFFEISTANVVSQYTTTDMRAVNDESDGTGVVVEASTKYLCWLFPELRDIDGTWWGVQGYTALAWQCSTDTTNGVDGTWTTFTGSTLNDQLASPQARTAIVATTVLGVRAVRAQVAINNGFVRNVHLYGEPAPGQNPHRLQLVKAGSDVRLDPAELDWGNVPRGSSADKTFRVKNLSPTLTAQSVRVAMEALTDTTPAVAGQHTLSIGGGSFLAQVNVGDLAPGAISGVVTLRRITPTNATLSLWWMRVFAEANAWV